MMTRHEHPHERHEVDSLLADSLQTTAAEDFDWKEPERGPRWWERAEAAGQLSSSSAETAQDTPRPSADEGHTGLRTGQLVFGTICLLLALWCLVGVIWGIFVDPLLVALGICVLCGLILLAAGLRPRRRLRL